MNLESWRALSPHLDRLLALDESERTRELAELRLRDVALADELALALAEARSLDAERFLEAPPAPAPAEFFSSETALVGQRFGAYTLESLLGQGGMGSVWLARRSDGRFEGVAAVKLLNFALLGAPGEERFRREGSILARLSHPHVARLFDAGVAPSGQPYLVLEHVEGEPIDVHCDRERLDVRARLRLFLEVLDAVAHAHANLVVHRDVKPSNVLVSKDGQVKLLDFGIAKLLEGEGETGNATALTRDAGRAFTPAFAAPEQVTGGAITTATDVYALGALLYLLLAGRHPAGDATSSPADLVQAIVETDPPRLSRAATGGRDRGEGSAAAESAAAIADRRATTPDRLARLLAGDLETVVAKALKKRPEERYGSVALLADDLRRFLAERPIAARPDSAAYRAAKFVRRHRLPVTLAAAALAALVAGLAGTLVQAREARRHAELARADALRELDDFLLSDAAASGRPFTVGELLARAESMIARRQDQSVETRVELLLSVGRQYERLDESARAKPLIEEAYRLSRTSLDAATRARGSCALGDSVARSGDFVRGEALVAEGIAELTDEPRFALARVFCLLRGSEIARHADRPAQGVARAEAAQRLLAASGQGSALLALRVEMDVAEAHRVAGDERGADRAFAVAFERLSALGLAETETAGTLLNNWALVVNGLGRPIDAEALYRRAIALESEGGDAEVDPMLRINLARSIMELGRYGEAADACARAYAEAKRNGDEVAKTFALFAWSLIETRAGNLERALPLLEELGRDVAARFPPEHLFHASLASQAGLLQHRRGDLAAARRTMDRAIALADATPQRTAALPGMLLRRSSVALEQGEAEQARSDAQLAFDLEALGTGDGAVSFRLGRAQVALGRALTALGRNEEAAVAFAAGFAQLEATLGPDCPETVEARSLVAERAPRASSVADPAAPNAP